MALKKIYLKNYSTVLSESVVAVIVIAWPATFISLVISTFRVRFFTSRLQQLK